jgi:hypothetical protein
MNAVHYQPHRESKKMPKGDSTLAILTSPDKSLIYSHLVKQTALELFHSELFDPSNPTDLDLKAAFFRVAGNACDDVMERALKILKTSVSTQRFMNSVREAHLWKWQGKW